jgi:hypothetical protein
MSASAAPPIAQPNVFDQFDTPSIASGRDLRPPVVPVLFRGEWNEDLSACGSDSNDSRLRIYARKLAFYESDGEVKRVIFHNIRAITVRASFAGEGQVWDADQTLVLSRSGNDLTITKEGSSFTRHRCPIRTRRK